MRSQEELLSQFEKRLPELVQRNARLLSQYSGRPIEDLSRFLSTFSDRAKAAYRALSSSGIGSPDLAMELFAKNEKLHDELQLFAQGDMEQPYWTLKSGEEISAAYALLELRSNASALSYLRCGPVGMLRADLRREVVVHCVITKHPVPEALRFMEAEVRTEFRSHRRIPSSPLEHTSSESGEELSRINQEIGNPDRIKRLLALYPDVSVVADDLLEAFDGTMLFSGKTH